MGFRRVDALTLLLLAISIAAVLSGLGRLPALTGDEAWIGLYALRPKLSSPHEMNTYTGPLYGLILSFVFALRAVSISSLRLPGACFNAAAFAILAANLRRRVGAEAACWAAALIPGSAYLLLKSRLAWETYALQPLLLAATLSLLDGPATLARSFLFCFVTLIGVQNHFISLSVPISLCVLYGARVAWLGEDQARPWLRLSVAALAASAIVFLVKPRLSDAAWPSEQAWAVPLFLSLAPSAAAAAIFGGQWESGLVALLSNPPIKKWARRILAAGLAAFVLWHAAPMWQIFAGPIVWRRVLNWLAPWWLQVPLDLWSALLLGLLAWRAVRAWSRHESMSPHERTLALWPAAYAAIFILLRDTSSLRYYSAIQFLSLASLAAGLPKLPRPDRRFVLGLCAIAIASAQVVFWRELGAPQDRRPSFFKIGWHTENSRDFARKDALFAAFDVSGACAVAHQERSFVAIPLDFHRRETGPLPCDPSLEFDADFCPDCAVTPFYRWSTVKK